MVDFNIRVVVDTKGAKKGVADTGKGLKKASTQADEFGKRIKQAFAFGAVVLAVRKLQQLADTFTLVQNRLRTVTTGQRQLNEATDALFAIANRTRSSFQATAEVFARVGLATKDLGITQKQTLQFTESLNQAVILSGASAQEANAGLIQLSQGLASGALRGDELRSVLESLPVVADVISKNLGITRGELRELGSQGAITAKVVLDAFKEARVELAERFGKSIPTLGQAFTILQNNLIVFIGKMNEATGVTRFLGQVVVTLAQNLDLIGIALVSVAAGFLVLKLPALIAGFTLLASSTGLVATAFAFLAANPLVLFAAGLTAVVLLMFQFREQILGFLNSIPVVSESLTVLSNIFKFLLAGGIAVVLGTLEALKFSLQGLMLIFQLLTESGANAISPLINFFMNLGNIISFVVDLVTEFLSQFEVLVKIVDAVTKVVTEFFEKLVKGFKEVTKIADRFLGVLGEVQDEMAETANVSNRAAASVTKDFDKEKRAAQSTATSIKSSFSGLGGAISEPITSGVNKGISEFNRLADAAQNTSSKIKSQSFSPGGGGGGGGGSKGGPFGTGQAGTGAKFFSKLGNKFSQTGKIAELGGGGSGGSFGSGKVQIIKRSSINETGPGAQNVQANLDFDKAVTQERLSNPRFGPGDLKALAASFGLQFQRGGSFTVGGSGGPDSQTLPLNLTPGEKVNVTTPKQEREKEVAGSGDKRPIVINFNITTDDADSFKLSQKQIISTVATEIQRITEGE